MRGILLAGGTGSRLRPTTLSTSKQLVPVFDKPLIFYSFSLLMLAGIREVLLITQSCEVSRYQKLLGFGEHLGMLISYKVQEHPGGIAQALLIGEEFIQRSPVMLVLGDNILFGSGLPEILQSGRDTSGALILAQRVQDPRPYAVVELDSAGNAVSIDEKPENPKTNFAVPGVYFLPGDASSVASSISPSARGELEITDVNRHYLAHGLLTVRPLPRGTAWFDAGSTRSLLDASNFVHAVQSRQGIGIAILEEIAFRNGWIDASAIEIAANRFQGTDYARHLVQLLNDT